MDATEAKLLELQTKYAPALHKIRELRETAKEQGIPPELLGRAIAETNKYYGTVNIEGQIAELTKKAQNLRSLVKEQTEVLDKYRAEIDEYTTKALEYIPSSTTETTSEQLVTLYRGNETIQVKSSDVANYLKQGWSLMPTQIEGGIATSSSKFDEKLDRYMMLNAVLDSINIAIERNNALESQFEGTDRIKYIEQENNLLKQKQTILNSINEEQRKERDELKKYLTSQGIKINAAGNILNDEEVLKARIAAYNLMPETTDEQKAAKEKAKEEIDKLHESIERYVELVFREIPATNAEWTELNVTIAKNNKEIENINQELKDTEFDRLRQEMEHWSRMGVYSIQQQIDKLRELYSLKKLAAEEQWKLDEEIFGLYKEALKEQLDAIRDAYEERIDLIDKEIDKINDEKKALRRSEEEHDYQKEMADLKKQLAYWSVRTSEEARKKVAELTEQITEKQHDREVELQEQALDDKADLLEEEKKKWQTAYKELEDAFSDITLILLQWQLPHLRKRTNSG